MDVLKKVKEELDKIDCPVESCDECKRYHSRTCVRGVYSYLKGLSDNSTDTKPFVGSTVRITGSGKMYTTYYGMFDIMEIKPSLAAMYTNCTRKFITYKVIAMAPHEDTNKTILCLKAVDYEEVVLISTDGVEVID